jgi:hypothetical protein
MRAWLTAASASARVVADRPALWLPGALAWIASIGWIPFLLAVARPPAEGDLNYLGAGIVSSGAWPWNAVLIGALASLLAFAAFAIVALANAVLIGMLGGRKASPAGSARLLGIALVAAVPGIVIFVALLLMAASVAPQQFNAPEVSGASPVLRIAVRLAPILIGFAIAVIVGAAFAAVAARTDGMRSGARLLTRLGTAGLAQMLVGTAASVAYLAIGALLLGVLWAPIGAELGARGEFDLATGLLLVGFVAIWLCLVLAGGALHAWSAATWSRLLAAGPRPIHRQGT